MNEAIRSSVLPVLCLLMHAPAFAQAPGVDTTETPAPRTEVFVDDARWVSATGGAVPTGAVAHGREPDGRPQYICRAQSGSGVHLGKVSHGSSGCVVVLRARAVTLPTYQVLTEVHANTDRVRGESVKDLIRRRWAESGTTKGRPLRRPLPRNRGDSCCGISRVPACDRIRHRRATREVCRA